MKIRKLKTNLYVQYGNYNLIYFENYVFNKYCKLFDKILNNLLINDTIPKCIINLIMEYINSEFKNELKYVLNNIYTFTNTFLVYIFYNFHILIAIV